MDDATHLKCSNQLPEIEVCSLNNILKRKFGKYALRILPCFLEPWSPNLDLCFSVTENNLEEKEAKRVEDDVSQACSEPMLKTYM